MFSLLKIACTHTNKTLQQFLKRRRWTCCPKYTLLFDLRELQYVFRYYGKEGLHEGKINNQLYVINLENDAYLAKPWYALYLF